MFQLDALNIEYVREYQFAKQTMKRKWACDFFIPYAGLVVEIEGGVWSGGRHVHPSGFMSDMEKYNALTQHMIYLLRFTPRQVVDGVAIQDILNFIASKDKEDERNLFSGDHTAFHPVLRHILSDTQQAKKD